MKSVFLSLFAILFLAGCFVPYQSMNRPPAVDYSAKFADKLEPGSKPIDAGYNYTLEQTTDGKFVYKYYFPETRQITHFITYSDKTLSHANGFNKEWWDDGSPRFEGQLQNGIRMGEWKEYNGNRTSTGKYTNGKQTGLWTTIDSLGTKRSELTYENGERNGSFRNWDEKGTLASEGTYKNGKIETIKKYTEDGVAEDLPPNTTEIKPMFGGCELVAKEEQEYCSEKKMLEHIYSRIKYPPVARENGIEGTAILQFVTDKDGSLTSIITKRGICKEIQMECEKIVVSMPKWSPGIQRDKPVRVLFTLPVRFKLE